MKTSIIQIGTKYQLSSDESNLSLLQAYKNCLETICYKVGMNKQLIEIEQNTIEYQSTQLDYLKGFIVGNIQSSINSNTIIPNLTDITKSLKFNVVDLLFEIDKESFLKRNLVVNLTFITKRITLVGTILNKLIIAPEDYSEKLKNKQVLNDLYFIELNDKMLINSYVEI